MKGRHYYGTYGDHVRETSPWHATDGEQVLYFDASCPVCDIGNVRLRYVYEWSVPDSAIGWRGGERTHSPEIVEQDCRCLLGAEFTEDALEDYLS